MYGRKVLWTLHFAPRTSATCLVVVARVDVARHAEVGDLDDEPVVDETVAGRQVAVDEVPRGEVLHPVGDLDSDVDEVRLQQREEKRRTYLG